MEKRPRLIAAVAASIAAVGVLAGCTVQGTASAPQADVSAYRAQQLVKKQKANARTSCVLMTVSMRSSVSTYNRMIGAYNSSGVWDQNLVNQSVTAIDSDIAEARKWISGEVPQDFKDQLTKMVTLLEAQKTALRGGNPTSINATGREMNAARDRFRDLCRNLTS